MAYKRDYFRMLMTRVRTFSARAPDPWAEARTYDNQNWNQNGRYYVAIFSGKFVICRET
jgi:hypothetical protein